MQCQVACFIGTPSDGYVLCIQYHQWVCAATEGGAQGVSAEGAGAAAQGQVAQCLSPAAGLLCSAVLGEGPLAHGTRCQVPA